ncbi:uncharacterized protein LOC129714058 [Leucoraja erinacea]|uniref:uncharacterized protein LOC129714058 n=1 Tax=Leucoraja erinaceus TaxID=7782 RepID=UPI002453F41A|nr:uncharacterized protein LOC129714058 [Leucoraja erinacea]
MLPVAKGEEGAAWTGGGWRTGFEGRGSTPAHEGGPSDADSGRSSPSSLDSLSLEWDPSVDIGDAGADKGTDGPHSPAAGMFIGLELKSYGTSRQDWRRPEAEWRSPEQVCVEHQCGPEVGAVSGEQGPGEAEIQKTTAGPARGAPGLGEKTVEMRRMREAEVDSQVGQCRDYEPPRVLLGPHQFHPGGDPGPMSIRDSDGEQWPHTTEPEQRWGLKGAPASGEGSGDSIQLRLPSGPARKSYLPLGRYLHPPVCLQHLCRLLAALSIFLLLALMAAIFLLPSLVTQQDWHWRDTFLPFNFALTYPNGPPPT